MKRLGQKLTRWFDQDNAEHKWYYDIESDDPFEQRMFDFVKQLVTKSGKGLKPDFLSLLKTSWYKIGSSEKRTLNFLKNMIFLEVTLLAILTILAILLIGALTVF